MTLFSPLPESVSDTKAPHVPPTVPQNIPVRQPGQKGQLAGVANPNHKGRNAFPEHLPRIVEVLKPEVVKDKPDDFVKIGQSVTETLDYIPAKLHVHQYIREKYVLLTVKPTQEPTDLSAVSACVEPKSPNLPSQTPDNTEGEVLIAPMPVLPLPKAIADAGLLAQIMVDKYVDHLPIDRQCKRWKRESGIDIKGSTIVGWQQGVCDLLKPLYDELVKQVFDTNYLQVDESTIKSLENAPKGKSHTAHQWVYRNPLKKLALFDYQRHRSAECLHPKVLKHHGVLQSDGYSVYDKVGLLENIISSNCWAHARREFFEAKDNHPKIAENALQFIQQLYEVEKHCREQQFNHQQIKEYRQQKAVPILNQFKVFLDDHLHKALPKEPITKAIAYTLNRWQQLCQYTTEGYLEIDNNLIENAIRPLALGRKNYLFVASDDGGHRTAMMYSFFASCAAHDINPLLWLTDVLRRIPVCSIQNLDALLPNRWAKNAIKA